MFSILRFIRYFIFARHRRGHGIHSPFVFDVVSRIFRNKIEPGIVFTIERIRKKMIADPRSIVVNDLGSGSKKMQKSHRKVSYIVRYSTVPRKYGILLANMSKAFGKPLILEFGTSLGLSTMYLAASNCDATVITMEGCKSISEIAASNFKEAGLKNIRLLNGSFDDLLQGIISEKICPALIFIDGNHRKEKLIDYFEKVANISNSRTVVIIDDINSSREMAEAWCEIKSHKNVTLSIDIFRMGMIFFREGLNHYDYVIRY